MYPYRTVERALTRLHGDSGAASLRISARIKHFIHLGFTPESPGKGRRISYTFEDVAKWAYALQLLEYGMDPTAMKFAVQNSWEDVWPAMEKEDVEQNDILFATPRAISYPNSWAAFEIRVLTAGTSAYNAVLGGLDFFGRMMINLSAISRELWAALEEAEAGILRDLSDEVRRIKAGEDVPSNAPNFPALIEQANKSNPFWVRPKPRTPRVQGPSSK